MILIPFPEQQTCLCLNTVSETYSEANVGQFWATPPRQACGPGCVGSQAGTFSSLIDVTTASFPTCLFPSQGKPIILRFHWPSLSSRFIVASLIVFRLFFPPTFWGILKIFLDITDSCFFGSDFSDLLLSFVCVPVKSSTHMKVYENTVHFKEPESSEQL